jgi:hypothetical protein
MTRSKFPTKVVLLATGIGLSVAAFAGSQPAAAQSYSGASLVRQVLYRITIRTAAMIMAITAICTAPMGCTMVCTANLTTATARA